MKIINHRILTLLLLVIAVGVAVLWWVAQSADKRMRSALMQQAMIAAQAINTSRVISLSGSEKDLNTPDYIRIKIQLTLMRNTMEQCKFLYMMGQRSDGVVFFFVDSLPVDSDGYAPPGLVYDEISDSYLHIFDTKQAAIVGPITDRWGTLITALIPIQDPDTGNLIAVLGMDFDASDWNRTIFRRCAFPAVIILLIGFLILLLVSRHLARKTQLENEEKLRNIIENSTNMFYSHTPDHMLTYISPQIKAILGYTVEEAKIEWTNLASDNPINEKGFQKTIAAIETGQRQAPYELELLHKNGKKILVEIREAPVVKNGKAIAIVGALTDITERKQAEKEKFEAQKTAAEHKKLALVGQVAGKMAHDFNNILGIIMGNTELSLMDCKDAETKKTLELIFEQTIRGKNLTRNLVIFAKDQEPKQEFFRISEKIDLVLNLLKKDLQDIELTREDKPGVPDLLADPGMIEHALVNLIQNSIHAVSLVEHPRIINRIYSLDDNICIEIEDNGCGIPKEHLENIFEPSFTLKGSKDTIGSYEREIKGTGYGMANVKKYIEQHKGSVSVESEFGSGTKFTISLPVIKKELTSQEKAEIQKENIYFDKYILLVEDEPAISGVQYKILSQEPCNHKVDIAHDGQVAMDLFKRNEYDLISLDYVLPGGINGMDVYDHIRKTNRAIPILFISGNIEFLESIKDLKQKDSNIDHLSKPCQNKDYVKSINVLFEKNMAS